jgi:hypothetical protein
LKIKKLKTILSQNGKTVFFSRTLEYLTTEYMVTVWDFEFGSGVEGARWKKEGGKKVKIYQEKEVRKERSEDIENT